MGWFDLISGALLTEGKIKQMEERGDVDGLIKALENEHVDIGLRQDACGALARIGDTRAFESLIGVLSDDDRRIRGNAAGALGKIGDARAVEPLITALGEEEGWVRSYAAEALGEIGDVRAVEPLIKALDDDNWRLIVGEAAAEALGKIGKQAIEPLIKALRDEDWKVRQDAVKVLGSIGGENVVEALIEALSDKNGKIRRSAARALGEIGDERAIEPLTKALDDRTKVVPPAAKKALKKIGGSRVSEVLGELKKKKPKNKDNENDKSIPKKKTKGTGPNSGIYSKITNDTDLKIYQTISDLEVSTEENIQKAGHFRTSDLTSGLKRLQSAGLIAFDEWNVGGYYTTPIELVNMLASLKSKNWKERDAAVRVLGDFLDQETEVKSFDKAVNALIKVMRTDKHMGVIFETNFSLVPVFERDLGQKHKEKVIEACCEVSRKAVEIAVKCGATKVPDSDNRFSDFSVKWGGTANNPRIDVSKCPWEYHHLVGAEIDDKKWENQTYAEMLEMIIYWQEI